MAISDGCAFPSLGNDSAARHPAGSLNPASMRPPFLLLRQPRRDLTEASRFPRGASMGFKLPNCGSLIMCRYELTEFEWGAIAALGQ